MRKKLIGVASSLQQLIKIKNFIYIIAIGIVYSLDQSNLSHTE